MKSENTREGEMESGSEGENRKARFVEREWKIKEKPARRQRSHFIEEKLKRKLQQQKEGNVVDVRLIHEAVGRDLICNSCQHHVPRSQIHSILCRKYSPHGPLGTRPIRCFTSCPNCFDEWELWPNNRCADSFDVLSGATYQEITPEHNPNSNLGGEGQI